MYLLTHIKDLPDDNRFQRRLLRARKGIVVELQRTDLVRDTENR